MLLQFFPVKYLPPYSNFCLMWEKTIGHVFQFNLAELYRRHLQMMQLMEIALFDVKHALLVWKPVRYRCWSDIPTVPHQNNVDSQRWATQLWLYLGSEINLKIFCFSSQSTASLQHTSVCEFLTILLVCTKVKSCYSTCQTHNDAFSCLSPLTSKWQTLFIFISLPSFPPGSCWCQ